MKEKKKLSHSVVAFPLDLLTRRTTRIPKCNDRSLAGNQTFTSAGLYHSIFKHYSNII